MSFASRVLDALFPFRIVARNTAAINKLARDKRRAYAFKNAAAVKLRSTVRRAYINTCVDENNLRAMLEGVEPAQRR